MRIDARQARRGDRDPSIASLGLLQFPSERFDLHRYAGKQRSINETFLNKQEEEDA